MAKITSEKIKIVLTNAPKKGSQKSIKLAIDTLCENYEEIKKKTMLGKGSYGSVYEYCIGINKCNYAVKIQRYRKNEFNIIKKEVEKVNEASGLRLSPQIYAIVKCKGDVMTLMDKVTGNTLVYYINNDSLTNDVIDNLFEKIDELHSNNVYHADLGPANIFWDGKFRFTFIDFNIRKKMYKCYYDYGTMLFYLNSYLYPTNLKTISLLLKKVIEKLEPYKDERIKPILFVYYDYIVKLNTQTEKVNKKQISMKAYNNRKYKYLSTTLDKISKLANRYFYQDMFL